MQKWVIRHPYHLHHTSHTDQRGRERAREESGGGGGSSYVVLVLGRMSSWPLLVSMSMLSVWSGSESLSITMVSTVSMGKLETTHDDGHCCEK